MKVFVDTSALYAVFDRDDLWHTAASHRWTELLSGTDELWTSNYVIVEMAALLQNRLGLEATSSLLEDVVPALRVEWIQPQEHDRAALALLAASRRKLSLVDCSSFEVIRRLRIDCVFTYDKHFAEQGFDVLG